MANSTARWNFFANVMDGALFSFAMSFAPQLTVLPLLVRSIGGGNIAVGLIPVVWTLGFNFPQFLIAGYAERQPRKKPLLLKTAMWQRLPWLLLAFAAYFLFDRVSSGAALALFFSLYAMAAVCGSLNLPVWFDLVAELTPARWRGRLFGFRLVTGSLLGILGGAIVATVLAESNSAGGFAFLLLLAFLGTCASYVFLLTLKEPAAAPQPALKERRGTAGPVVRHLAANRNLRNYIIADALQISSTMALAFVTVAAVDRFSLPDSVAGKFTMIVMGSTIAGGLLFGVVGDRFGHKTNLILSAVITLALATLAIFAKSVETFSAVFICAGMTTALGQISRLAFLAELAEEGERPSVIALANMISSPFMLWGAIGGAMANTLGYNVVFLLTAFFAAAAALWLTLAVRDPMHARPGPTME